MKNLSIPFICIGCVVVLVGNRGGLQSTDPPINYHTTPNVNIHPYNPVGDIVSPAAQAIQPHIDQYRAGAAYNNGYTASGHQNTLIGDMAHQLAHEGRIRPETLNAANDILSRCQVIPLEHQPPVCQ